MEIGSRWTPSAAFGLVLAGALASCAADPGDSRAESDLGLKGPRKGGGPAIFSPVMGSTVRIAAGSAVAYTDPSGNVWNADTGFAGGIAYGTPSTIAIAGTDAAPLYNAERYGADASGPAPFDYSVSAPAGTYTVKLKFAEIYVNGPGQRLFDVAINGSTVLSGFDIYAAAGGQNVAVDRSFDVTVGSTGKIEIHFAPGATQNPKVDAIEILSAGGDGGTDGSMDGDGGGVSCAGQACSGHGTCSTAGGSASCACDGGFYASGLSCVSGSPDVTVDWSKVVRTIDPKAYGVDCPACAIPENTQNPAFLSSLHAVTGGQGLVRIHGWGMIYPGTPDSWVNDDHSWNAPKIVAALTPTVRAGYAMMIDIPAGPGGDGDDDADRFASFAAGLVRIVNVDNRIGVKLWEIPNEQENKLDASQMTTFLSKAITAMKAEDPTILVGGPATAWINAGYITSVVQGLAGTIDFVTCHTYGGDGTESHPVSYQRALSDGAPMRELRNSLDSLSPNRHIPIFLDEYAIGWNGTPAEQDHRGAVYNILVQGTAINAGADATAIWSGAAPGHDMSIIDSSMNLTDAAKLFQSLNQYGHGASVTTSVVDPSSVFAFATKDTATSTHLLVAANLTGSARTVTVATGGWAPTSVSTYRLAADGYVGPTTVDWASIAEAGLVLPAESVVMVVSQAP